MKRWKILVGVLLFWASLPSLVGAETSLSKIDPSTPVSRETVFRYLGEYLVKDLPKSYHSINLEYSDVEKDTKLYDALQKLIYVDALDNELQAIYPRKAMNAFLFYSLAGKILDSEILQAQELEATKSRVVTVQDLGFVQLYSKKIKAVIDPPVETIKIENVSDGEFSKLTGEEYRHFRMLLDVYETLQTEHYDKSTLTQTGLLYGAMGGMTEATKDKFTTFFPPAQSQSFNESLIGEFEGIGAYVEMEKPGVLTIISPINNSPAQQSGLKGGDIITTIDGMKITESMTVTDCVARIKGPAGTKVKLEVLREDQTLTFEVTRAKIVINDVQGKELNQSFYFIQISMFGDKVVDQFNTSMNNFLASGKKKLIIDLRDNPGGYLESVTEMLSRFVPKGEPTAVVKYQTQVLPYTSSGENHIGLGDYQVYILINSGTASASEIFVGTLKDYFPGIVVLGEQSYGKGSVQTVRSYYDGSSLKYTIAKWFTGKSQTTIDKVGIAPDIKLESDPKAPKPTNTLFDPWVQYILSHYGS